MRVKVGDSVFVSHRFSTGRRRFGIYRCSRFVQIRLWSRLFAWVRPAP